MQQKPEEVRVVPSNGGQRGLTGREEGGWLGGAEVGQAGME